MKKLTKLFLIRSVVLASVVGLCGCSTWDKLDNKERGAVIGGGSGALLGGSSGSSGGALLGGAVGAVGGGLIGNEVDNHDRRRD